MGSGGGVAEAELGWGVPFPTRITTLSSNGAPREDGCAPSLGAGAYSPRQAVQAAEPVGKPPASSFSIAGPHSFIHGCPRCACRRRGMPRERQAGGPALAATRPARTGARHRRVRAGPRAAGPGTESVLQAFSISSHHGACRGRKSPFPGVSRLRVSAALAASVHNPQELCPPAPALPLKRLLSTPRLERPLQPGILLIFSFIFFCYTFPC